MSKPTNRAFPLLGKPQLLISLAMLTILFLALTAEGGMTPTSSFSATNDCLIGTNFPVSQESGRQEVPAIAYNSQNNEYLVVWQSKGSAEGADWDICGQVVSDTGDVPAERSFCTLASDDRQSPAIAYNSSNNCQYLVVWQDDSSIYPGWDICGQLMSCTGEQGNNTFCFFKSVGREENQDHPAVAYNSNKDHDEYLVVWQDERCYSYPNPHYTADDIYGWRVNSEGNLEGDVIPISIAADCELDESIQQSPAVAYNSQDNQYLVVWEDNHNRHWDWDIYGQLLSYTGDPLRSDPLPIIDIDKYQQSPDLAYNSEDKLYLVVWQDKRNGNWDIYGRQVLRDGTRRDDFCISCSTNSLEENPAMAYNSQDNEYLVVWQVTRNGCADIYGQRVGSDNSLLGCEDIHEQRVGSDDSPLGDEGECPIPISTAVNDQEFPDVAYSQNNEYIVVWQDEKYGEDNDDIYGQLVGPTPTPTPTTQTPTLTPTPTTQTPTLTPTPTNTITSTTPTSYYLYLPIIMKNHPFCNGDFETGDFSCWTPGGDPLPSVVDYLYNGDPPYSGEYCALLGESISCEEHDFYRSWIYQDFTIPADAPSPTLNFAYRIFTNDILGWASFRVEIRDLHNVTKAQVLHDGYDPDDDIAICNNDLYLGWRSYSYDDLSKFRGQTIRLWFEIRNEYNDGLGIWTYVDDVTVTP